MHPVAIKYLCETDIGDWAAAQLAELEKRLGWQTQLDQRSPAANGPIGRGIACVKEVEYFGHSKSGKLPPRRDDLIEYLLRRTEQRLEIVSDGTDVRSRVRAIRSDIASKYFSDQTRATERARLRNDVAAADLALALLSYPEGYLEPDQVTDTRLVETIQRMQESFLGKANNSIPLRAVIQCDEPIVVPIGKVPRNQSDPLMDQLRDRLACMVTALSREARPIADIQSSKS